MRGSDPPRCHAHRNDEAVSRRLALPPGAEYHHSTGRETAPVPGRFSSSSLKEEIQYVRLILTRLLADMETDPTISMGQLAGIAQLVFSGARTVSRLLRDQHALSGAAASEMDAILKQALAELGIEWGLEL